MKKLTVSRRALLKASAAATASMALATCAQPTATPVPRPTTAPAKPTEVPKPTAAPTTGPTAAPTAWATPSPGGCVPDWPPETLPPFDKYDPPIKISTIFNDAAEFLGSDTWTDNPCYNRIKNHLGIEYIPAFHSPESGEQRKVKMAAAIASGQLPDMWSTQDPIQIADMIDNGMLEDITDVFEATASAQTKEKKRYKKDHIFWACVTRGGRIYGVPWTYGSGFNADSMGWIRQDLLDKVSLPVPQTTADLDKVLHAWKAAGLCAYGLQLSDSLYGSWLTAAPIFGAYGAMPGMWLKAADGSGLVWGNTLPGCKEALRQLAAWYRDGLIDPDYYTKYNWGAALNDVGAGKSGALFGPWYGSGLVQMWETQNPGTKWVMMDNPKGPAGESGGYGTPNKDRAVVYRKGVDKRIVEATIKELNWQIEKEVNWDKYHLYGEGANGAPNAYGYSWEWDDKCNVKQGGLAGVLWHQMKHTGYSASCSNYHEYGVSAVRISLSWLDMDPSKLNKMQLKAIKDPDSLRRVGAAQLRALDTMDRQYHDQWAGVPGPAMRDRWGDLTKLDSEYFTSIVTGKKPIDAFDQYVKLWKSQGGDQVTAEVSAWYKSQGG